MFRLAQLGRLPVLPLFLALDGGAAWAEGSEVLNLVERGIRADGSEGFTIVDNGEKGPSAGDMIVDYKDIYDKDNKVKVGETSGYCIWTLAFQVWQCNFTLTLDGGQIMTTGPFFDKADRDAISAVVGGTGKYAGARGEERLRSRGTSLDYDLTITLRY
jgi:hypothetical protein